MKIAAYQMDTALTAEKNREKVLEYLNNLDQKIDLLVVPEMFTTGFSMDSQKIAEPMDGPTLGFLIETAKLKEIAITGSVAIKEEVDGSTNFYNRMFFVYPSGEYSYYDKHHLFRMASEHNHYSAGDKRVIVEYKGFKIMLQICYDLRFPIFSRNCNDYDMIIYVASWPTPRVAAWNKLLLARAIENLAYVVSVNRVGDFEGLNYSGGTHIIDYKGDYIVSATPSKEEAVIGTVNKEDLDKFRAKFPASLDADPFMLL